MSIILGSSTFLQAEELVRPAIQHLPPDVAFDLIKSLELALSAAATPPEWFISQDADRYCRWRWRMSFVGKDRPPYRPVGKVNYYRREDIDRWAITRIEGRPEVSQMR